MMESVEIESKKTNGGNNTKTYNGQKVDNELLGISFGSYISKEKQIAQGFASEKIISNFSINCISSKLPAQKWGAR